MSYDNTFDYILSRLRNAYGAAEGGSLPPLQTGDIRVPIVNSLKVANTNQLIGSTVYYLTWNDPENISTNQISHYNVFITQLSITGINPTAPVSVQSSPARIELQAGAGTVIIFTVQTVLTNGMVSDISVSPSCTYVAPVPSADIIIPPIPPFPPYTGTQLNLPGIQISGLTLHNNTPGAGQISWDACTVFYQGNQYNISSGNCATTDKYITWTVGNTSFTPLASYTPTTTIYLIATNTSGTADTAWDKVAESGIQTNHIGDAQVVDAKITGTLTLGGTATLTKFLSALDGTNTQVVWMGKNGTDYGIWAKNCWIGGTGPSDAVVTSSGSGVVINGATFTLNLNGATTTIGNTTVLGIPRVGLDVKNNTTSERAIVAPDFITIFNGSNKVSASIAHLTTGAASGVGKFFDGTDAGGFDGHGLKVSLDGSTGNIAGAGTLQITGSINVGGALTGTATGSGVPVSFQPQVWLSIQVGGVTYKVPLFNP